MLLCARKFVQKSSRRGPKFDGDADAKQTLEIRVKRKRNIRNKKIEVQNGRLLYIQN